MKSDIQPEGGLWTYEEFAKLPEGDGNRYEIIAGDLYVWRNTWLLHQVIVGAFATSLFRVVDSEPDLGEVIMGPIDVLLAVGDFLVPDYVYVRPDRREIITDRAVEGVPDLIIEIVSPMSEERDRGLKRERYFHHGVPEYWIVDPEDRTIERFLRMDDGAYTHFVETGGFEWQPVPGKPALSFSVPELLKEYDEMRQIVERNECRAEAAGTAMSRESGSGGEGLA